MVLLEKSKVSVLGFCMFPIKFIVILRFCGLLFFWNTNLKNLYTKPFRLFAWLFPSAWIFRFCLLNFLIDISKRTTQYYFCFLCLFLHDLCSTNAFEQNDNCKLLRSDIRIQTHVSEMKKLKFHLRTQVLVFYFIVLQLIFNSFRLKILCFEKEGRVHYSKMFFPLILIIGVITLKSLYSR